MALTKEEKAARRAAAAGTYPKPGGVAPEVRPNVRAAWDSDTGCWRTPGGSKHLVQRNRKRKLAATDTRTVCMDIDAELSGGSELWSIADGPESWRLWFTAFNLQLGPQHDRILSTRCVRLLAVVSCAIFGREEVVLMARLPCGQQVRVDALGARLHEQGEMAELRHGKSAVALLKLDECSPHGADQRVRPSVLRERRGRRDEGIIGHDHLHVGLGWWCGQVCDGRPAADTGPLPRHLS